MDHAIIRPSQSLVKGGGPAAQFRLSDGASITTFPEDLPSGQLSELFLQPRSPIRHHRQRWSGRVGINRALTEDIKISERTEISNIIRGVI
jgi:hypothetical protein